MCFGRIKSASVLVSVLLSVIVLASVRLSVILVRVLVPMFVPEFVSVVVVSSDLRSLVGTVDKEEHDADTDDNHDVKAHDFCCGRPVWFFAANLRESKSENIAIGHDFFTSNDQGYLYGAALQGLYHYQG